MAGGSFDPPAIFLGMLLKPMNINTVVNAYLLMSE